jgi:hypothetical protein
MDKFIRYETSSGILDVYEENYTLNNDNNKYYKNFFVAYNTNEIIPDDNEYAALFYVGEYKEMYKYTYIGESVVSFSTNNKLTKLIHDGQFYAESTLAYLALPNIKYVSLDMIKN